MDRGSSDGANPICPSAQCTKYTDACFYDTVGSSDGVLSFSFFFLVFGMWYFGILGPRNVYKDMINNKVSPINHVVMNHQNQTRINGIWGHVRYSNNPIG
jgi:hypothetical protein